jgi:hypothetical protein
MLINKNKQRKNNTCLTKMWEKRELIQSSSQEMKSNSTELIISFFSTTTTTITATATATTTTVTAATKITLTTSKDEHRYN